MNEAKLARLEKVNELLAVIASCGRRFFHHEGRISRFYFDERGRLWFWDKWSQKGIYVAYEGRWREFSEGGTLRDLVIALGDHIRTGKPDGGNRFGPWPDWYCKGDLWGYGADMGQVRDAATRLEIRLPDDAECKV